MHRQSYSQYFFRALLDFKKVNIPGLGLFSLEQHTAELSLDKRRINPPSSQIQFHSFEDDRFNISKLLIEEGLDHAISQGIETYYTHKAKTSRDNNEPFVLEGLGKVISTSFLPDQESIFNIYDGLQAVNLVPVGSGLKNIVHDEDYLYNLTKSQSSKSTPTFINQYLWPSIIGLVTLFVILFWFFGPKADPSPSIHPSEINAQTDYEDTIAGEEVNREIETEDAEALNDTKRAEKEMDAQTPILASKTKNLTPTKNIDNVGNCIIIVGSFKNLENAKRMMKKISGKGYQTFTSEHQGLKRVGVKYNCNKYSPDSFKSKIRSQFNSEAWSLSDTI